MGLRSGAESFSRVARLEHQMEFVHSSMRNMEAMIRRLVEPGGSNKSSEGGALDVPRTLDEWVLSSGGSYDQPVPSGVAGAALPDVVSRQVRTVEAGAQHPQSPGPHLEQDDHDQDNDDFLLDAATGAPMKDILYRDEEERLRQESMLPTHTRPRVNLVDKGRSADTRVHDPFRRIGVPIPVQRGDRLRDFPDPIQLGHCSEQEGRRLFDL